MRVLNIGSINIDHVYSVDHFVRPGETLSGLSYQKFTGGKGFNQSIALARAGAVVHHLGCVGEDGGWQKERLEREGVETTHVKTGEAPTGHAVIQVDPSGENAIVIYGGANESLKESDIDVALSSFSTGDYLLIQNETNRVAEAIAKASAQGLRVVFNPAPMTKGVIDYHLETVDIFILNETEAEELTGKKMPEDVREEMCKRFPKAATVLTAGSRGAYYFDSNQICHKNATPVDAIDTTAAGDTFIGYFLAELMRSDDPARALSMGCRAAAICVTRMGASDSIPTQDDLEQDMR